MKLLNRLINSSNKRSQIAKRNILGSLIIKAGSIIVQLLLVPLTLGYLSDELYGIWITISSVVMWMGFFDIGITLGLKNKLAIALANGDIYLGKRLISTTYGILCLIFIPLGILGYIFSPLIPWTHILNVSDEYTTQLTMSIQVAVICICGQQIFSVITPILQAYQKVALSSIFTPLANFISLFVIIYLTKFSTPSLYKFVSSVSFIPVIILFIGNLIYFFKIIPELKPSIKSFSPILIKDLLSLGFSFFFLGIQYIIVFQSINFTIATITSPIYVTQYNIVSRYLSIPLMIFSLILSPFWPAFTEAYVKNDYKWMKNIYIKLSRIYVYCLIGLIVMAILSPIAYALWIKNEVNIPYSMTCIVVMFTAIHSWNTLQQNLLNGIGIIRLQVIVTLIGSILYFPMAILLGKLYGVIGIILSITIISSIYSVLFTKKIRSVIN